MIAPSNWLIKIIAERNLFCMARIWMDGWMVVTCYKCLTVIEKLMGISLFIFFICCHLRDCLTRGRVKVNQIIKQLLYIRTCIASELTWWKRFRVRFYLSVERMRCQRTIRVGQALFLPTSAVPIPTQNVGIEKKNSFKILFTPILKCG